jgi:hypothetical protein
MGSGFKFEFDPKELERQVMKAAESGMKDIAWRYERVFDSMRTRYAGHEVAEIKPVLRREWSRINGSTITDPDLTTYAQAISEGTKVKFKVQL